MTSPNQPSLFDQPGDAQTPAPTPDMADVAARIAANAPKRDYEVRTSEAAADQGWGPIEPTAAAASEGTVITEAPAVGPTPQTRRRPTYESRHGDSELDGGKRPDYFDPPQLPTAESKALGKLGLAFARSEIAHSEERQARSS